MKTKMFFIFLPVFALAILFSACGSSDNTYYETPQDWKNGNAYSGTYTAQTSFVWYMQTALVDITYNKLNTRKGESTMIPDETNVPQPDSKDLKSKKNWYDAMPMINADGQMRGVIDNPDPNYKLRVQIFQEGIEAPIIDEILAENQPGNYCRAISYLLPGTYTKILTPISDLAEPECKELNVTAFEVGYLGIPCYWVAAGGTGDWGQR